ncbi:hypothetical protein PVAND_015005 [Polypedilum vanderplanki]|uniref:Uncharacterized protein n=1 Tax=Polypedilum vanderplanki TaxID=319348 RepID=A0A9J6BBD0_POLVA|nr:hypothetical protein PVAND_015005 [Polypedilum vanderplanki]
MSLGRSSSFSRAVKIPMPMPITPPSSRASPKASSTPKPSAPDIPLNEFSQFFRDEFTNTSVPYPSVRLHCYYLKLDVKRDWNRGFALKDSANFLQFATEIEDELRTLLAVDESFKIQMVHAEKDKWSSRRILLTFVMQTMVNFGAEKFQKLLKEHIKKEAKITTTKAYLRDLKVRKTTNSEYDHMVIYGCNPCDVCDQILKKHRKIDVNNPSSKPDILCFFVVILTLALIVALLLLKFIK